MKDIIIGTNTFYNCSYLTVRKVGGGTATFVDADKETQGCPSTSIAIITKGDKVTFSISASPLGIIPTTYINFL